MKKGIIFDFDGVIINSLEIQRQALVESYKIAVGAGEPSFNEFLSYSGDSLERIFSKMQLPTKMVDIYRRISRERIGEIKVYHGMKDLLRHLKESGYKCGLCTGKDRLRTEELLDKLMLSEYFETVVCSNDVENPKPHPESLLLAIKNLGLCSDKVFMIGDARNDILCAKSAGVKSIAVTWGCVDSKALKKENPDYIVSSIDELKSTIENYL